MMKRRLLLVLLSVGLLASCCNLERGETTGEKADKIIYKTKQKEKFVNPLFYKTMYPLSTLAWKTKITPTEMLEENVEGFVAKRYCTMLENKTNEVVLKCIFANPVEQKMTTSIWKFAMGKRLEYLEETEIFIVGYYRSLNDDHYIGTMGFYIDTTEN